MARRFEGSKPGESLTFQPEALAGLRVDPNPSRFGPIVIEEILLASLAQGQLQECLVRKDAEDQPVLYVGRNRLAHVMYINAHPERWPEWGIDAPLGLRAKYIQVSKEQAEERGIDENLERKGVGTLGKAQLAQRYHLQGRDDKWIAQRLRLKSTSRVTQLLDLFSLGDPVLILVAEGRLTEAACRTLKGLSEAAISDIVQQIQVGTKPHTVLAAIREQHRQGGRLKPRSGKEVMQAVAELRGSRAADFRAWMKGDSTVRIEEIFL
jgi:ParB-like chromosome segregation protein Spo0J